MAELLIIFIATAFILFFSGIGIAYISANKMNLEVEKQKGTFSSNLLTIYLSNPEHFFLTLRVGYFFSLIIYAIAFTKFIEPQLTPIILSGLIIIIIEVITSALIILLIVEFLARTVFKINAIGFLEIFAFPLLLCYMIFYPLALICQFISKGIVRYIFFNKKNTDNDRNIFTMYDLDNFEKTSQKIRENDKEETEIELFRNALDFSKVKVRDCIVPRTELEAIEDISSIDDLKAKFIETGYSKILIYNENIDNIIGYVHSSQMFRNPSAIESVLNPVSFIPETMMASNLLSTFTQKHKSIAIVVDEFGGTSGMVTTEDILEEIFGEIEDEHDTDDLIIKKIKENEWIISARYEISNLNGKYHFNLPEDDEYDTIAGLILNQHENIPKKNSVITIGNFEFRILKATETRIELVLMKINATN